jgi:hypothetical protein
VYDKVGNFVTEGSVETRFTHARVDVLVAG